MKKLLAPLAVTALLLTGCSGGADAGSEPTEAGPPADGYPEYSEIDPYTSGFFIGLEDEDADTYIGLEKSDVEAQFLWNMGVFFCKDLDDGRKVGPALERLMENSNMGNKSGSIAGAAVLDICTHHQAKVQDFAN